MGAAREQGAVLVLCAVLAAWALGVFAARLGCGLRAVGCSSNNCNVWDLCGAHLNKVIFSETGTKCSCECVVLAARGGRGGVSWLLCRMDGVAMRSTIIGMRRAIVMRLKQLIAKHMRGAGIIWQVPVWGLMRGST